RPIGVIRREPQAMSHADPTTQPLPEVMLTARHARRGEQLYPVRRRPIDQVALDASLASSDPYRDVANIQYVADYDDVFRRYARMSLEKLADAIGQRSWPTTSKSSSIRATPSSTIAGRSTPPVRTTPNVTDVGGLSTTSTRRRDSGTTRPIQSTSLRKRLTAYTGRIR